MLNNIALHLRMTGLIGLFTLCLPTIVYAGTCSVSCGGKSASVKLVCLSEFDYLSSDPPITRYYWVKEDEVSKLEGGLHMSKAPGYCNHETKVFSQYGSQLSSPPDHLCTVIQEIKTVYDACNCKNNPQCNIYLNPGP